MKITKLQLGQFDQRERAHFINQLTGFKPAMLVGTKSREGNENLALFSQVMHIGANPALIGILSRPDTVPRDTLTNIKQTKAFSLNQVTRSFYPQAHQTAARYAEHQSEFAATGLTPLYDGDFIAPMVKESPLRLCLSLEEIIPIKANGTTLVIGQIESIDIPEEALSNDKTVNYDLLDTVVVTGLDTYYHPTKIARLSYAKPDKPITTYEDSDA
ncbi:MAG: flavin reductase [Cellvibrionales bacterium]|nr:flavin reductase [Cellvibrionales bacterium]